MLRLDLLLVRDCGCRVVVLLLVLMLCTYVPAVPMFLVEYFYR